MPAVDGTDGFVPFAQNFQQISDLLLSIAEYDGAARLLPLDDALHKIDLFQAIQSIVGDLLNFIDV